MIIDRFCTHAFGHGEDLGQQAGPQVWVHCDMCNARFVFGAPPLGEYSAKPVQCPGCARRFVATVSGNVLTVTTEG